MVGSVARSIPPAGGRVTVSQVAALYVRADTPYRGIAAECFDMQRDARTYAGNLPVVAHPPCRAWGRLRHFAKPRHDERGLGLHAVDMVRQWGGVLEHPASSTLWAAAGLPAPGQRDPWGGFTLPVLQSWWGHQAPKATWLYIVGREPASLPAIPYALGIPAGRVENMGKAAREATPPALAAWLCQVAEGCAA
jgi:hypothetical protein